MKKLLFLAFAILAGAMPVFAQTPVILSDPADWGPWIGLTTTAGNAQRCVDLNGKVITDHTFNYQPINGPSAVTITITGTRAGAQSTITTGGTTTGGSIHFTGTYSGLCFVVTTLTGNGALVNGSYKGVSPGASGAATIADGADTALGTTTDTKSTATDGTAATLISLTKQLSAYLKLMTDGTATSSFTDTCQGLTMSSKYYISVGSAEDESQVKATSGTLCTVRARNAHASTNAFLKCTNLTAANTTPGSSAVFFEMMIPAASGYVDGKIDAPFSVALTCYIVTGKAANDATEVGADDVSYFLTYQ